MLVPNISSHNRHTFVANRGEHQFDPGGIPVLVFLLPLSKANRSYSLPKVLVDMLAANDHFFYQFLQQHNKTNEHAKKSTLVSFVLLTVDRISVA
ncbi:unnamed protein product [Protopolystoma xenopodis]|uniref:Uncharacterized protein n=1 Tax=Protopolystoma xenopodis TaxID=117903 RepID=A0A448XP30_9PLAT|nr:unnamed protein product [Protopolystoma xenopodis]